MGRGETKTRSLITHKEVKDEDGIFQRGRVKDIFFTIQIRFDVCVVDYVL